MKNTLHFFFALLVCCATCLAQENDGALAEQVPAEKPVESIASLKLPKTFPVGYPIRFGVMEFTSSVEMLVKDGTTLGKLVSNAQGNSLAIPTGASYLNVELGRRNPQYYNVFAGKNTIGMGYPELQQAVAKGLVTHVIQCVISDANYKETSGEFYGVSVSETVYNLDLNVTVFDLTRNCTVLTGTYNAERTERKPFNRDHYEGDIFQVLLKIACQKAADGIVAAASAQKDGSAPKIQPAE